MYRVYYELKIVSSSRKLFFSLSNGQNVGNKLTSHQLYPFFSHYILSFPLIFFVFLLTISQYSQASSFGIDEANPNPAGQLGTKPQDVITLGDLGAKREWIKTGTHVVLDVESTGIQFSVYGGQKHYADPRSNRVIQLTIFKYTDGKLVDSFNSYFNPGVKSTASAYKIHKLSSSFLASKPTFADKFDEIVDRIFGNTTTATVVGHHVGSDIGLLRYEFERVLAQRQDDTVYNITVADTLYTEKRDNKRRSQAKYVESPQKPTKTWSRISEEMAKKRLEEQLSQREKRKIAADTKEHNRLIALSEQLQFSTKPEERERRLKARKAKQRRASQNQSSANAHSQNDKENATPSALNSHYDDFLADISIPKKRPLADMPNLFNTHGKAHSPRNKRQKVKRVSYTPPSSFSVTGIATWITDTKTAGDAARVGMLQQGLDSTTLQEACGVPAPRLNMPHEAVVDVMNTATIIEHQSDTAKPVVLIHDELDDTLVLSDDDYDDDLDDDTSFSMVPVMMPVNGATNKQDPFVIHSNLHKIHSDSTNPDVIDLLKRIEKRHLLNCPTLNHLL